jgi:hypothetical protein
LQAGEYLTSFGGWFVSLTTHPSPPQAGEYRTRFGDWFVSLTTHPSPPQAGEYLFDFNLQRYCPSLVQQFRMPAYVSCHA